MDTLEPGAETPAGWKARVGAYLLRQAKDAGTVRSIAVGLAFAMGYGNAETFGIELIALIGMALSAISAALPAPPKKKPGEG